jgi:hypothetical protein
MHVIDFVPRYVHLSYPFLNELKHNQVDKIKLKKRTYGGKDRNCAILRARG